MKQNNTSPAFRIALCALMAALGTVLMLSSNLIPILTYVAPMLASLVLIPVLYEFGPRYAWMTWAVTAALALLLCADREAAFFFLFVGYYPILKPRIDRLRSKTLRVLVKLFLFAAVFILLFVILAFVMGLEDIRGEMLLSLAVYAVLTVTMMIFDRVCGTMTILYERRLRERLFRKPR